MMHSEVQEQLTLRVHSTDGEKNTMKIGILYVCYEV